MNMLVSLKREDNIFIPMVEHELSDEEKSTLSEQFKHEEELLETKNPFKKNLKLLNEMEQLISDIPHSK